MEKLLNLHFMRLRDRVYPDETDHYHSAQDI